MFCPAGCAVAPVMLNGCWQIGFPLLNTCISVQVYDLISVSDDDRVLFPAGECCPESAAQVAAPSVPSAEVPAGTRPGPEDARRAALARGVSMSLPSSPLLPRQPGLLHARACAKSPGESRRGQLASSQHCNSAGCASRGGNTVEPC